MDILEQIMAQRREEHEARMRDIQQQEAELKKKRNQLRHEFKVGNRAINDALNKPTEHSIASHRLQNAHNIKRIIERQIKQWSSPYIDTENAGIGFEMKDDCIQFGITIRYKQHPAETIGDENKG